MPRPRAVPLEGETDTSRRARLDRLCTLLYNSPQKNRIARGVHLGLTNREIAMRLGCSVHNIHSLLQQIYDAASLRGRVELGVMVSDLVRESLDRSR